MDIKIIIEIIFVDKNLTNDRAQVLSGFGKGSEQKQFQQLRYRRLYLENFLPSFYWFYSNEEWDEMRTTTTTTTTVRGERKKGTFKIEISSRVFSSLFKSPLQNSIHAIIIIVRRIFIWWRLLVNLNGIRSNLRLFSFSFGWKTINKCEIIKLLSLCVPLSFQSISS